MPASLKLKGKGKNMKQVGNKNLTLFLKLLQQSIIH